MLSLCAPAPAAAAAAAGRQGLARSHQTPDFHPGFIGDVTARMGARGSVRNETENNGADDCSERG